MKASRKSEKGRITRWVLTDVQKVDGSYPGVASAVRGLLDQGQSAEKIAERVNQVFGTSVNDSAVGQFRTKVWVPEKELVALKIVTIKSAVEAFGGDAGLDAAILAKLWELMDDMTIPQLLSARSLFVKVRAQNLKEQEFLYRTGQLKPAQASGDAAPDPETQQRNVLRRIKEIFGLAGDEEEETPAPQLPAAAGIESA